MARVAEILIKTSPKKGRATTVASRATGPGNAGKRRKKVAGGEMAYPTGEPRGWRTTTTRTSTTETGRHVQECTKVASMTGEGPTVSSWGGVNAKHTIPTCAPKPEDREALLPPPWSDGDDVPDITKTAGTDDTVVLTDCVDEPGSEGVTAQAEAGDAGSSHDG